MSAKLSITDVRKRFGERTVLDGVSIDVAEHEVVCLIGASGSGKSTLLRCINLLEPVDDGRIELDGVDITEPGLDPDPVRRRIGLVFQSYNLFPHMSVLANITLAPTRVLGTSRAEARTDAQALLERFGLADKADAFPDQLSGGQQQRVAIVRALAMRPELMLLDEVTAALDDEFPGRVTRVVSYQMQPAAALSARDKRGQDFPLRQMRICLYGRPRRRTLALFPVRKTQRSN